MGISTISALITELSVVLGVFYALYRKIKKISDGSKCQLRSAMLNTYYHNKDKGEIRQYEYENFVATYEAYKALGGNSFIDKIYAEVKKFEVIT